MADQGFAAMQDGAGAARAGIGLGQRTHGAFQPGGEAAILHGGSQAGAAPWVKGARLAGSVALGQIRRVPWRL
jgi:hypothetical protein